MMRYRFLVLARIWGWISTGSTICMRQYYLVMMGVAVLLGFCLIPHQMAYAAQDSVCYGSTKQGRLSHGVPLPGQGKNFVAYSNAAHWLGRTYVHSTVRKIVVDAYKSLESEQPNKKYKYAETGFEKGGPFKPHKTHQNGLSVDFTVQVVDSEGNSILLPTHPFNKYGYGIEFDQSGRYDEYTIDYEALAAHIVALDKAAKANGVSLWRVIFDPVLQPFLLKTSYGEYLKKNIRFSKKRSWVRHDAHYHVDLQVPCRPITSYQEEKG